MLSVAMLLIGCQEGADTTEKFEAANSGVEGKVEFGSSTQSAPAPEPKKKAAGGSGTVSRSARSGSEADNLQIIRGDSSGSAPAEARAPKKQPTPHEERGQPTGEQYTDHGVRRMTSTAADPLSTFAVDVDTGSYTVSRRKLESGTLPPAAAVRVEEFVNYFDYGYSEPDSGPFAVDLEAAPSPFSTEANTYLMRVGVQGKHIDRSERKPVHLTYLVDVSGSMSNPDKLGLAKRSLRVLTNHLREGDTVALATYAGRTAKILEPTGVEHRERILSALETLKAGGSTAMNSGLEQAYELAMKNYEPDHVNRVVVLSDGDANVGPSSHEEILDRIQHFVDEGVTLSTIGFGMGNYQDTTMEQLANNGNGNYYYVDSMDEARKIFGRQVNGTLQTIAKDVKIQVEFDERAVSQYRLVGYENRHVADEDFRNEQVDAGEIGAGHTVTAFYEVQVEDPSAASLATVRIRNKPPKGTEAREQTFALTERHMRDHLNDASAGFRFGASVTAFAEILRDSPYAEQVSLDLVEEVASSSAGDSTERQEFLRLVRKAQSLTSRKRGR